MPMRFEPVKPMAANPARANPTKLSCCAVGGRLGYKLWHYEDDVLLSDIRAPAFFGELATMLGRGNNISVTARDGFAFIVVSHVRPGEVWTENLGSVVV